MPPTDIGAWLTAHWAALSVTPQLLLAYVAGALGVAAGKLKVALPADVAVDAEVDLGTADSGYLLRARLNVSLPGLAPEVARELADAAHEVCPYSKATRGNIDVAINVA